MPTFSFHFLDFFNLFFDLLLKVNQQRLTPFDHFLGGAALVPDFKAHPCLLISQVIIAGFKQQFCHFFQRVCRLSGQRTDTPCANFHGLFEQLEGPLEIAQLFRHDPQIDQAVGTRLMFSAKLQLTNRECFLKAGLRLVQLLRVLKVVNAH